jgi:putative acetyltransferase
VSNLVFHLDDLSGEAIRALVAQHLHEMTSNSPEDSCHAFGVDQLREPGVLFWSAWADATLVGCGALKHLDPQRAEIKSMRVTDSFRRTGAGRAILEHLIAEARARGFGSLWLETGSSDSFIPALNLYRSAGFETCPPFGSYKEDPFSVFMTLSLKDSPMKGDSP